MSAPGPTVAARRSGFGLLLTGVVAAVLTGGLWLYLAGLDGVPDRLDVPAGQSATSAGGVWQLVSLQRRDTIANSWGEDEPVTGATYVVASLSADLRGADPEATCRFDLIAGALTIHEDTLVGPGYAGEVCRDRGDAPVTVVFEVPVYALDSVSAVTLDTGVGDRGLRLAGTIG